MNMEVGGLMAALPSPRAADGRADLGSLERTCDFALARGVRGVVPCGGTGEYFDLRAEDRRRMVEAVLGVCRGRAPVVAGVGAATLRESVGLAEHALGAGAAAVLLPPPYFYRYGDTELVQFFRAAGRAIGAPTILYNLASFVSPISAGAAAELIGGEEHITGIKDSSGRLEILRRLTAEGLPGVRIQGHDARLADSSREGLLDGAISGPASVVPELSAAVFDSFGDEKALAAAAAFNAEFIGQIEQFPYPWALKWIAAWRGLGAARLPFPLSEEQESAARRFRSWFDEWLDRLLSWRAQREVARGA